MSEREEAPVCTVDGCTVPAETAAAQTVAAANVPVHELSVVSDAICPWCYVGKRRLEKALQLASDAARFKVVWRPFELNPDMPKEGMERKLYRMRKFGSLERSQQLDAQLTEAAKGDGLSFRYDLITRTPNTLAAHRLIWLASRDAVLQDRVVETLFRAYFTEGRNIGDIAILADLAAEAGIDRAKALAFLQSEAGTAEVRADEGVAQRAGLSGVPTFVLDGRVLFSGAQHAELIARALSHSILAEA